MHKGGLSRLRYSKNGKGLLTSRRRAPNSPISARKACPTYPACSCPNSEGSTRPLPGQRLLFPLLPSSSSHRHRLSGFAIPDHPLRPAAPTRRGSPRPFPPPSLWRALLSVLLRKLPSPSLFSPTSSARHQLLAFPGPSRHVSAAPRSCRTSRSCHSSYPSAPSRQ